MSRKLKIGAVVFLLFMSIAIDSVSMIISMLSDAVFVGGASVLLFGLLKENESE